MTGGKPGERRGSRKKSNPNKATSRREREIAKAGQTPLEYMLRVIRDSRVASERRDRVAVATAPYVHPKLSNMQHSRPNGGPIPTADLTNMSRDDLDRLEALFGSLAGTSGDDAAGDPPVGDDATARALDWADYLRSHANRLYAAGGIVSQDGARLIVERRRQLSEPFSAREVQRRMWSGLTDREAVADAIEALIATNHVREVPADRNAAGGRPSVAYEWNPALKVEG